jgi:predicted GIY-YIG superfamily endonuclease
MIDLRSRKKYVYLLKCNEYYKIGVANCIELRVKTFQTGNPYKITFLKKWSVKDPYNAEGIIHVVMKHKLHKNEWFVLDENDIKKINEVIYYLGGKI